MQAYLTLNSIDKVKASAKAAAKAVETKKAATDDREKKTEDAMKANDVYVAAVKKQGAAQAEAHPNGDLTKTSF